MGALLLLFFIFSMNALLFGYHAVQDGHVRQVIAGLYAGSDFSHDLMHHDHGAPSTDPEQHDEGEMCCQSHMHAGVAPEPVGVRCLPLVTAATVGEPFKAVPEVYLDRFIPPQKLA